MLKVLYSTDGSADAVAALRLLEMLPLSAEDEVRIVSVVSPLPAGAALGMHMPTSSWELLADVQVWEQESLQEAANAAAGKLADRGFSVSTELRRGDAAQEILAVADAWQADLILLGTRGLTGLERFVMGSVVHKVAQQAHRPVLVARNPGPELRRVVIAIDDSEHAQDALEFAARLPLPSGTGCVVLNVVRPYGSFPGMLTTNRAAFNAAVQDVNRQHRQAAEALVEAGATRLTLSGKQARGEVREGDPAEEILRTVEADSADLLIVGARGVSAIRELLLGSVADRLLKSAPCSVLVVH